MNIGKALELRKAVIREREITELFVITPAFGNYEHTARSMYFKATADLKTRSRSAPQTTEELAKQIEEAKAELRTTWDDLRQKRVKISQFRAALEKWHRLTRQAIDETEEARA